MSETSSTHSRISLEDIEELKLKKLQELQEQKKIINGRCKLLFAPIPEATNKVESLMRTVNTGMAIFDGVMFGMKILGRVRNMFHRRK